MEPGNRQNKKLDTFIEIRKRNAAYFMEKIMKTSFLVQKEVSSASWFGFAIILPEEMNGKRDEVITVLRDNGIEVRPIVAGNFVRQKALDYLEYSIHGTLKNADYIHDNGFFVGNHSVIIEKEIDVLAESLKCAEEQIFSD